MTALWCAGCRESIDPTEGAVAYWHRDRPDQPRHVHRPSLRVRPGGLTCFALAVRESVRTVAIAAVPPIEAGPAGLSKPA